MTAITQRVGASFVSRTKRQVRSLDLPHEARLEPHIWLVLGHRAVRIKRFRSVNGVVLQLGMKLLEYGFRKPRADIADRFVRFIRRIVASQQESAVHGRPLALAKVCAEDDEIEGIADAGQIVLFHFEPIAASLTWLVATLVGVEHLDHESFAGRLDALIEQGLDFLEVVGVAMLGERKFAFNLLKRLM